MAELRSEIRLALECAEKEIADANWNEHEPLFTKGSDKAIEIYRKAFKVVLE